MCADAMCPANWSRLSRPVPCLAFLWAESTNYILLAGGQALNDTIPRTNITQQTLLTRVRVELRHRTRDARLAASNQASAGNKPTALMKKGASSHLIIMQWTLRRLHAQSTTWTTMQHYLSLFELLVDDLAEWGPESIMVLNNYISVPSESAQRAATKRITR